MAVNSPVNEQNVAKRIWLGCIQSELSVSLYSIPSPLHYCVFPPPCQKQESCNPPPITPRPRAGASPLSLRHRTRIVSTHGPITLQRSRPWSCAHSTCLYAQCDLCSNDVCFHLSYIGRAARHLYQHIVICPDSRNRLRPNRSPRQLVLCRSRDYRKTFEVRGSNPCAILS